MRVTHHIYSKKNCKNQKYSNHVNFRCISYMLRLKMKKFLAL